MHQPSHSNKDQPKHSPYRARLASECDIAVGKKLKEYRQMRGLSQKRLAQAIGISAQQIHKYEKGKNRVPFSRIGDFARVFQVSPSILMVTLYSMPGVNTTHHDLRYKLAELSNRLTTDQLSCLVEVAEKMKSPSSRSAVVAHSL